MNTDSNPLIVVDCRCPARVCFWANLGEEILLLFLHWRFWGLTPSLERGLTPYPIATLPPKLTRNCGTQICSTLEERILMSLCSLTQKNKMVGPLVVGACLALLCTAAIASPLVLDWRVNGTGTVTGTCQVSFVSGCTSTSSGVVLGTHIGSGTYTLSLT